MTLFSSCTCVHLLCVLYRVVHAAIVLNRKLYISMIIVCLYMYIYVNQTIQYEAPSG